MEDRILELQDRKRELIAAAFGEDAASGGAGLAGAARLSLQDLHFLLRRQR